MNTKTITAKIIEEIHNSARINDVDTEVIEAMLKDALNEYYDAGHSDGYSEGYDDGYDDGRSEGHY